MSPDRRCTLRISGKNTFVDGEKATRADAVAYCKRAPGGAVIVLDENDTTTWDAAKGTVVVQEDGTKEAWNQTRSELERAGVRIYVRGPLCYDPRPLGCRPWLPAEPRHDAEPKIVPSSIPVVSSSPPDPTPSK